MFGGLASFFILFSLVLIPRSALVRESEVLLPGASRSYPYMIEVFRLSVPVCGGAMIHPRFVITACSCLATLNKSGPAGSSGHPLEYYVFVVGTHHLEPFDKSVQKRTPKEFYVHPQCAVTGVIRELDIGAAEMIKPFETFNTIHPAKLLSTDFHTFEKQLSSLISQVPRPDCRVSGWERPWNSSSEKVENELESVRMILLRGDECLDHFRKSYPNFYKDYDFEANNQICATTVYTIAPFLGDFGDPLVCDGFLVGVVSNYGPLGTKTKILPTVFQTMSVMLDWIEKNKLFQCCNDAEPTDIPNSRADTIQNRLKLYYVQSLITICLSNFFA